MHWQCRWRNEWIMDSIAGKELGFNWTLLVGSCLDDPMDRGAWQATAHGVAKSQTQLSDFPFTFHFHALEKEWQPTLVFLPGESQGQGSLVGCHLWGRTESDTTEATQQQQQALQSLSFFAR